MLPTWKASMMAKAGQLTLVKSVLAAIPLHELLPLDRQSDCSVATAMSTGPRYASPWDLVAWAFPSLLGMATSFHWWMRTNPLRLWQGRCRDIYEDGGRHDEWLQDLDVLAQYLCWGPLKCLWAMSIMNSLTLPNVPETISSNSLLCQISWCDGGPLAANTLSRRAVPSFMGGGFNVVNFLHKVMPPPPHWVKFFLWLAYQDRCW
jgi:hypothetical protein